MTTQVQVTKGARGRRSLQGVLGSALSILLLLGAWLAATHILRVDPLFLPSPDAVSAALYDGFTSGLYVKHLATTAAEVVLGFAIAIAGGIALGVLIGQWPVVERTLNPLIVAFQSTPKIAFAPILIVWFGLGISSKVVIVALIAGFPILVSTLAGLARCAPGRIDVMRSLRASRWQQFWLLGLPSALPMIFAGIEVASVFVVLAAVAGEFVGAKAGMGVLILHAQSNIDTAQIFAVLIVMAGLGLMLHRGVQWIRRRVVFWAPADTGY